MNTTKAETIDAYIAGFPEAVQQALELVRQTIREAAPGATEAISYAIPTFKLGGNLIHFAGYKNHIGIYPAPAGDAAFVKAITPYKSGKATVQFPLNAPMPLDLITKMVRFRIVELSVKENKKKPVKK